MAFLGLFKRDKRKSSTDAATNHTTSIPASDLDPSEPDYVLPSLGQSPTSIYSGPPGASSSKLRLGFKTRRPPVSRPDPHPLSPPSSTLLNVRSESENNLLSPPPPRSAIFTGYGYNDPPSSHSTRSLPTQPTVHSRSSSKEDHSDLNSVSTYAPSQKKGLFSWAHRERKKSIAPPPPAAPIPQPDLSLDSFNLRSFRHIGTESPTESPTSLVPPARPRPRDDSFNSNSSQRISVAAFREAQARRSATNSPVPSFSNDAHSPGLSGGLRPPSMATSALRNSRSISGDSDTDDSEEEENSEASSTLKPRRKHNAKSKMPPVVSLGKKSVSELGHKSVPASRIAVSPSANIATGSSRRESVFARPRASVSTSALTPNAAARRASILAELRSPAQTQGKLAPTSAARSPAQKARSLHHRSSSSSSSSSSSDSDSDNAPLASLVNPKRPGSAASSASRARTASRLPPKPLIDLSGLTPPTPPVLADLGPPPVPAKDSAQDSTQSPTTPRHSSKPNLNDRLIRLAKGTTTSSVETTEEEGKMQATEKERGKDRKIPRRSQTQPPESISPQTPTSPMSPSPSPALPRKPNGRSMSSPNALPDVDVDSNKSPIIPTAIRTRTPPPAFAVTSRPPSQVTPQAAPRTSEETVRVGRARASTLISDGDLASNLGFTGGGLLGSGTPPSSTGPTPSGLTRPRQRAETMASPSSPSRPAFPASTDGRSRSSIRPSRSPSQDLPAPRLIGRSSSPETGRSAGSTPATSPPSRSSFIPKSALKSSSQQSVSSSSPATDRSRASFATPVRPFAGSGYGPGMRGNSPASSTGDSSSGRTPITPVDGSDIGSTVSAKKHARRKSSGVAFDEPDRGRSGLRERERSEPADPEESRRERRRSEAIRALEYGKILNGEGPIDVGTPENMGPRMSVLNTRMGPMGWAPQSPQDVMNTMYQQAPDPVFLAAHQQAMMVAKQAFQMSIAQQALAAANEEWERGSNATSAYGAFGGMGGGMFPPNSPGYGMSPGLGWMQMFPSSQQPMYAGSVIGGSELGVNPSNRSWGIRSAYGEQGGYAGNASERASMALRNSQYGGTGFGSGARSEIGGPTSGRPQRPRTKTNPSDLPLPSPGARSKAGGPPPSSWNTRTK